MPSAINSISDQSAIYYYKSFVNFINVQSKTYADRVFVRYYSNNTFKTLTYSEVDRITTNLACEWAEKKNGFEAVSYMNDHNVDYMFTMLALMKLRIIFLAISPRNSEPAIVNLLEKTQSKVIFATPKYESIAQSAAAKIDGAKLTVIQPLDIEAMLNQPLNPRYKEILDFNFTEKDIDQPALIIHSSGSTNFPKPIYLSNRYLLNASSFFQLYKEQYSHVHPMNEDDTMLACVPLFHLFGLFCLGSIAFVGASTIFLKGLPPSQKEIDFALRHNNCTVMAAPPIILEQMIPYLQEHNDFSAVQRLKFVLFGGAPFKREAGEWFQAHNVNVRNAYGSTEMNVTMCADLDPKSKNWNSLRPIWNFSSESYIVLENTDDGLKHLYLTSNSPTLALGISNRPDGGFNNAMTH
ncbi:hypothetical protein G6F49_012514 [Rhizopus delemar]|nr:hypothetical protein G6F49_012514 [Rhizopus delemar]KAG1577733.1 hypothetical protein G6F48_012476 [Rhizopus delemar]KAG1641916.1 hypothetical protein G6F44_005359 [Rhizopus delemar]